MTQIGSTSSRSALEAILPASVAVEATRSDVPGAVLLPGEAAAVARAVEGRRREFASARACARAALERWGFSRQAIPMQPSGAPLWPPGIVGSITHCDGFRGCAVARQADVLTVGIDAEPNRPLPERILSDVAFGEEPALIRRLLDAIPSVRWDRLLFSAKESVFKAWFPLAARRLGFEGSALTIDPQAGTFSARLLVPGPLLPDGEKLQSLTGKWNVEGGLVVTAIAVTPAAPTASFGETNDRYASFWMPAS